VHPGHGGKPALRNGVPCRYDQTKQTELAPLQRFAPHFHQFVVKSIYFFLMVVSIRVQHKALRYNIVYAGAAHEGAVAFQNLFGVYKAKKWHFKNV
jgi:hypothetical protein